MENLLSVKWGFDPTRRMKISHGDHGENPIETETPVSSVPEPALSEAEG